jgi:hypothetical protein
VRQEFPSHFFFVYPPMHSYALAGWLKVLGVSAASMTGFQMAMYFVIAAATIGVLRRHGAPVWMEWLVPLGVNAAFFNDGLRTEPLAAAFLMTGYALVECVERRGALVFPGFLLLALGGLTAPRTMVFAVTFACLIGWRFWRDPAFARRPQVIVAIAFAAAVVAGVGFLWLIDFRLGEFLHTFHYHASGVIGRFGPEKVKLLQLFLRSQTAGQWLLMALPLPIVVALSFKRPFDELTWVGFALAGGILVTALMGGLYYGSTWYPILVMFLLAAALARKVSRLPRMALMAVMIPVFLAANSAILVEAASTLRGDVQTDLGPQGETARALVSTPDHPLLVDMWVARYLYDYRLPAGCIDLEFGARFPAFHATQEELRPGDIYLVGPQSLRVMMRWTHLNHDAPEEFYALRHRWKLFRHPREVYVVAAEECGSIRKP